MLIKVDLEKVRSFASMDAAVGKVEVFLGGAAENHARDLHWLIVPVPVTEDSRECRYVPVFFSTSENSKWLARSIAEHGWPFYG
jgi:hypothetical protein